MPVFLASFVGNSSWFGVLIGIHVAGAIIGLGPTFAFPILGAMGKKATPEGGLALLETSLGKQLKRAIPDFAVPAFDDIQHGRLHRGGIAHLLNIHAGHATYSLGPL